MIPQNFFSPTLIFFFYLKINSQSSKKHDTLTLPSLLSSMENKIFNLKKMKKKKKKKKSTQLPRISKKIIFS